MNNGIIGSNNKKRPGQSPAFFKCLKMILLVFFNEIKA